MDSLLEPGIFRHPRPKKNLLPSRKKMKMDHKIEEINFDLNSREEYLTGFHKRKLARIKAAQAEAGKKAREERILMRKKLRDSRKQELEEHVNTVNAMLGDMESANNLTDNESTWDGISDTNSPVSMSVDHFEEYVDEERYTTVTIESVDVSRSGLIKPVNATKAEVIKPGPTPQTIEKTGKNPWPKKAKKKFRYETKAERKMTRAKMQVGKKKRIDARKEKR
ncbi:unnamed protein product [Blumeria hordei]|uniref:Nucleolar protein 12 n=2 Tax=Blumeria hordei TaxID=2867405 RepID=A0A383UPJ9_BLUHO|nr:hypothetical protein BGHDH14_bgh01228 [Blumeria hordei DH14]SZF01280.1 unnamed protein product [Blumeria hordei]